MKETLKKYRVLFLFISVFVLTLSTALVIHFFCRADDPIEYTTMDQISRYAKTLKEFPTSDDEDWLDPHYAEFYKTRILNPFMKILRDFGYYPVSPWSPKYLNTLLKSVTKQNKNMGLVQGKNSFLHLKSNDLDKVLVFSDLHAAFHSLVRSLGYLKEEKILDNNLKLIKSNYFIIFNGDAIDRSPYNIDTLILILTLMKNNPHQVFYIAGNHERDSHWHDYGLRRELISRGQNFSAQETPFNKQVNNFFDTLPEAFYISGDPKKNQFIRISFKEQKKLSINELAIEESILSQKEKIKVYTQKDSLTKDEHIDVRAVIKTEEWRQYNRIKKGIGILDQDQGATTWAFLSSPISVHIVYLDFYFDAFGEITLYEDMGKSTVASRYQDIRLFNGFSLESPSNLFSAKPLGQTYAKNTLSIASTLSLVRGVPTMGQLIKRGINNRINQFNQRHGNHELTLRLYTDNDDYIPKYARSNVMSYLKRDIPFLLAPTGTPTIMAYINSVLSRNFGIFFPVTGSSALRSPKYKNTVHFRATYEDEVRALIKTMCEEYGALKFAFFYQDDSYGRGPLKTALNELKKYNITNATILPYTRGNVSFVAQTKSMLKSQPDALGFFSTATAAQEFIRQLGVNNLINTQLFGISFVGEQTLRHFAHRQGLSFIFGSSVPNPQTSQTEIAKAYRQAMDKINSDYDVFSFEAYIATSIFLHALEHIDSKDVSPKKLIRQIEKFKNYDFMGLRLNFDPETRSLAGSVWLESGENQEWKSYPIR